MATNSVRPSSTGNGVTKIGFSASAADHRQPERPADAAEAQLAQGASDNRPLGVAGRCARCGGHGGTITPPRGADQAIGARHATNDGRRGAGAGRTRLQGCPCSARAVGQAACRRASSGARRCSGAASAWRSVSALSCRWARASALRPVRCAGGLDAREQRLRLRRAPGCARRRGSARRAAAAAPPTRLTCSRCNSRRSDGMSPLPRAARSRPRASGAAYSSDRRSAGAAGVDLAFAVEQARARRCRSSARRAARAACSSTAAASE